MSTRTSVLGTKGATAATFDEMLIAAGLNWEPLEDQVQGVKCGLIMPREKLLYRSDNLTPLGVVGEGYVATQPREFLKSQYELAEAVGGKVIRAGWTDRRSKAFCVVEMMDKLTLPKNIRKKGDPVGCFIYTTDGWDGRSPRESNLYLERLMCANGMVSRQLEGSLWASHKANLETNYSKRWLEFQTEVKKVCADAREQFVQLAQARMGEEEMKAFLGKLIPGEGKQSDTKRTQLLDLFKNGVGLEGKTKWDALNAVTEYVTHHREYRDTPIADAATNRFLGVVSGRNPMNERAMALLLS